jgi:DNA-directed RNA polymerase specialized sigma24 family protein
MGQVSDPWQAAMYVYCGCLHDACCGSSTPERQEIGYTELQRYLYQLSFRIIMHLPPDVRWEIINETLLRIWEKRASYYKPGAFLSAVVFDLRNVIRPLWSQPDALVFLDDYIELQTLHNVSVDQHIAETISDPVTYALTGELRDRVRRCFDDTLRRHPRAKQQLEAVWLKYIAGLNDDVIGRRLGKSVANVYVLRSRGLDQLRTEPDWQLMAEELGIYEIATDTGHQHAEKGFKA